MTQLSNPIQPNPWMNPIHVQLCANYFPFFQLSNYTVRIGGAKWVPLVTPGFQLALRCEGCHIRCK